MDVDHAAVGNDPLKAMGASVEQLELRKRRCFALAIDKEPGMRTASGVPLSNRASAPQPLQPSAVCTDQALLHPCATSDILPSAIGVEPCSNTCDANQTLDKAAGAPDFSANALTQLGNDLSIGN